MPKVLRIILGLSGAVLGILMFLAGISPKDAGSNISAWIEPIGLDFPALFQSKAINWWAVGIGLILAVLAIILLAPKNWRKRHWHPSWEIYAGSGNYRSLCKFVSLKEAAEYAYGHLHGSLIARAAENRIFSSKPANPPRYIATRMIKTLRLPLYGYKPFSQRLEEIHKEEIRRNKISDDLVRLEENRMNNPIAVYERLQMKVADVKNYIREQKERE